MFFFLIGAVLYELFLTSSPLHSDHAWMSYFINNYRLHRGLNLSFGGLRRFITAALDAALDLSIIYGYFIDNYRLDRGLNLSF